MNIDLSLPSLVQTPFIISSFITAKCHFQRTFLMDKFTDNYERKKTLNIGS
jgi:hypothetical protein